MTGQPPVLVGPDPTDPAKLRRLNEPDPMLALPPDLANQPQDQQPGGPIDWAASARATFGKQQPQAATIAWGAAARSMQQDEFASLQQSFEFAVQHDPKVRAEAQDIARELGVDPDTVGRNLDVMRAHLRKRVLTQMNLQASSPVLAKFMQAQEFADIAHRDAEKMSTWERMGKAKERGELLVELGRLAPLGFNTEMTAMQKQRRQQITARLKELGDVTRGPMAGAAEFYGQTSQVLPPALTAGAKAGTAGLLAGAAGAAVLGQAGPQALLPEEALTVPISAAAFGTAGFTAGFTTELWRQMAMVEGGNAYFDMLDKGYDEGIARWAARGLGAFNATVETAQLGFLLRPLRGILAREVAEGVAGRLAQSPNAKATVDFLKNYGMAGVSETAQELIQESAQIVAEELARPESMESLFATPESRQKLVDRLAGTAVQTMQTMALIGLPIPVARFVADVNRAVRAESFAEGFAALMDAAKAVDMRSFARADFEAWATDVTKGGDRENVYVDAKQAQGVLLQSAREDADVFRTIVGDEVLANAAERGEDVVISTGTYAANIAGTPLDNALRPHAKFNPDAWSLHEAEQFKTTQPEVFEALKAAADKAAETEDAREESLTALETRLRGEIEAASKGSKAAGKEAAKVAAAIVRSIYQTLAERSDIAVDKLPQISFERGDKPGAMAQAQPGRGWFDPERLAIALTEKADRSTVFHELWHAFSGIYIGMATDAAAPTQVSAFARSILDRLGLTNEQWQSMDFEQRREPSERLAVLFEEYMATGKAPTLELQGAFQKAAAWIRNVYRYVRDVLNETFRKDFGRDLPVLDADLRRMFDLMIASEDAIASSDGIRGQVATWDSRTAFPGTDEQWSGWKEMADAVRDGAVDQLVAATMRNEAWLGRERDRIEREIAKEAKALRKGAGAEAAQEMALRPVYRVRTWLKQGKHLDAAGKVVGARDPNHKIRAADIRAVFGGADDAGKARALQALNELQEQHDPDGVPADVVAQRFGYETGETMLRELLVAPTLADAIDARTDEIMMRDHGDLRDAESQAAAVSQALNNEAATRLAAETLRIVARIKSPDRLTMAAVRELAADRLAATPMSQLAPSRFARMAARAASEAQAAFAGKRASKTREGVDRPEVAPNPLAGIAALQRQMLAQEMVRQAAAIEKEVGKLFDEFAKADRSDTRLGKTHDLNMVGAARSVLFAFDLGTSSTPARQHMERVKEYDPALYDTMAPVVDATIAQAKPWKQLTLGEFRELAQVINGIMFQSRRAKELWFEGRRENREEAIEKVLAAMLRFRQTTGTTVGNFSSLGAGLRHVESWSIEVDGGTPGPVHRYLFAHIREPFNAYQEERNSIVQEFLRATKALDSQHDLDGPAIEARELIDHDGKPHVFKTRRELVGALMHFGNASNARKDWVGRGWVTDVKVGPLNDTAVWAFFDRLIAEGKITKLDLDYVQATWDLYARLLPRTQEANRDNYGEFFHTEPLRPIRTKFGVYKGGYVPAKADKDHALYVAPIGNESGLETARERQASHPSTGRGFTITRTDGVRALSHDLRLHQQNLDEELRFIHLQRPGRDIFGVLGDPRIRQAIQQIDKNALGNMFLPWLKDTMQNRVIAPGGDPTVTKFLTILRRNTAAAFMFGNVANAAQQVTGLASSATYVPMEHLRASAAAFLRGGLGARNNSKSTLMRLRTVEQMGQLVDDMDVILDGSWLANASAWTQKHAFFLQRWLQNPVDHITFDAAYNHAIAQGKNERDAVLHADSIVRLSQSSGTAADLSKFERGSALQRLFFQLSGFWITQWNTVVQRHGVERWKAAGITMAFVGLLGGAIAQALRGGWDDDDEDGAMWDDISQWAFGEAFQVAAATGAPIVGPMAARLLLGENQGRLSAGASLSALESSFRGLRAVAIPFDADRDLKGQDIQDVAMLSSILLGIPLTLPAKGARFQFEVSEGNVVPTSELDYLRGLLTGRASAASRQ